MLNEPVSMTIKNQRHSLSADLDEWLKHNKPTVLERGVSLGQVRFVNNDKSKKRNAAEEKKAEAKIIEKNKDIALKRSVAAQERAEQRKKQNELQLMLKQEKRKQRAMERINEQMAFMANFMETAEKGDLKILSKLGKLALSSINKARRGMQPMSDAAFERIKEAAPLVVLRRKEKKETNIHYKSNVAARKQAIAEGKIEYTAVCVRHGETTYALHANGTSRCRACQKEKLDNAKAERKLKRSPEQVRMQNNFNAMMVAVEKGETSFIGVCVKHGEGKYSIKNKKKGKSTHMYKCFACIQDCVSKQKEKRALAKARVNDTIVTLQQANE